MKRTKRKSKAEREITKQAIPKTVKQNNRNSIRHITALITSPILFILMYLLIPTQTELTILVLNKNYFLFGALIISLACFVTLYFFNTENIKLIFKIGFVASFIICLLPVFYAIDTDSSSELISEFRKISAFAKFFMPAAVTFGSILIWLYRQEFTKNFENAYNETQGHKPSNLKAKIRQFGIGNTALLILILSVAGFTMFYKLDSVDLYSDEATVLTVAKGYMHSGEYRYWDFVKNDMGTIENSRAYPHVYLVSLAFRMFGVNEWSNRFFSAVFGIMFCLFAFLISYYFTKNKTSAFLVSLSVIFIPEYLMHFRWGRMYAMFIPLYLLMSYLFYRGITETNTIKRLPAKLNTFVTKYLNFHYGYLLAAFALTILTIEVHLNAVFIFLLLLFFLLYLVIFEYKHKYLAALIAGIAGSTIFIVFDFMNILQMSALQNIFKVNNSEIYFNIFTQFPFGTFASTSAVAIITILLFFIKKPDFRKKYVFLLLNLVIGFLTFSFLFDYAVSFRYISFLFIFPVILFIDFGVKFFKTLFSGIGKIAAAAVILIILSLGFTNRYNSFYFENELHPGRPSIACQTVNENATAGDLVLTHYLPHYFLRDINPEIQTSTLGHFDAVPFDTIYEQFHEYDRGWIVFYTSYGGMIDQEVVKYANLYFTKYHGTGIDDTNMEVFFYTKDMLKTKQEFENQVYMPYANINMNQSITLSFRTTIRNNIFNPPFFIISEDSTDILELSPTADNAGLKFKYPDEDSIEIYNLNDTAMHHIVFFQDTENNDFGLYVDGSIINEKELVLPEDSLAKFLYNPEYSQYINYVRIFLRTLDADEVEMLYNNGMPIPENDNIFKEELKSEFSWVRKE
jgi:hypothetical protein